MFVFFCCKKETFFIQKITKKKFYKLVFAPGPRPGGRGSPFRGIDILEKGPSMLARKHAYISHYETQYHNAELT